MEEIRVRLNEFPVIRVSFENISVNNVEATDSHAALKGRDLSDQHPISAITGLEEALRSATDSDMMREAAEYALAEAKASGEFDGVSVTHFWDGTVLTVTSASGTSSADLKGDKGSDANVTKANVAAALGYTPIDPAKLTLGIASDGLIYVFVNGSPVGSGIPQGQSGDVFGYVDENNTIVLNGNLADGSYSVKYEMENGDVVDIGNMVLDSNVYYSVTNSLTNCTSNNSAKTAVQGGSYSATISANSGYELKSVTVTMGGSPVSVSGATISIAEVTGDIVITAVAEEVAAAYTNLADPTSSDWGTDKRIGSDGTFRDKAGVTVTNFIGPLEPGDVIRAKGIDLTTDNIGVYTFNKTVISVAKLSEQTPYYENISVSTTEASFTAKDYSASNKGYVRLCGVLNSSASDVIITINEPIE